MLLAFAHRPPHERGRPGCGLDESGCAAGVDGCRVGDRHGALGHSGSPSKRIEVPGPHARGNVPKTIISPGKGSAGLPDTSATRSVVWPSASRFALGFALASSPTPVTVGGLRRPPRALVKHVARVPPEHAAEDFDEGGLARPLSPIRPHTSPGRIPPRRTSSRRATRRVARALPRSPIHRPGDPTSRAAGGR